MSSTTSSARLTESASTASSAGVGASRLTTGSGTCTPAGSSGRAARERSRLRQTRATTVVSQPPGLPTSSGPVPLTRTQASWSASSASADDPSIR